MSATRSSRRRLGIRALMALLPILASIVVIVALQRYPLHGERYRAVRNALAGLRGRGARASDGG